MFAAPSPLPTRYTFTGTTSEVANYMRLVLIVIVLCGALTACAGGSDKSSELPPIPAPADVAAAPADAVRTPSNLASRVLKAGSGTRHPRANSEVTVHYTGWTT